MSSSKPIVKVKEGSLQGTLCDGEDNSKFYSFKGIPFAQPPVGDLRFRIPEPPTPWEGVRDATKECTFISAQMDHASGSVKGGEDCLYLNVHTPALALGGTCLLPVMVYIHGGGFIYGRGTEDSGHGPDFLISKGVVVVNMNYRLGILGFLNLNLKEAPGNMGLRDQVMALRWVQQNIAQFNGDPNNVTIFGASAGAASVEYLVLSKMTKGLFHKAISQAGSSLIPWALNRNPMELAFKVSTKMGKNFQSTEELLKHFQNCKLDDLIKVSEDVITYEEWKGGIYFGFVPTVESPGDWEPFLGESPELLLKQGDFNKVPYLAGCCSHEGLLMLYARPQVFESLATSKNFIDYLAFNIDDEHRSNVKDKLEKVYLNHDGTDDFAVYFFTDVDFLGGTYYALSLMSRTVSPVYMYHFCHEGELNILKKKFNITRAGVCHSDDGGYIMRDDLLTKSPPEIDCLVRDRMTEMWTNFAKYGNPTPEINEKVTTKWEPFVEGHPVYLRVTDQLKLEESLLPERIKLFRELYEKYYP
ncbi:unnamed protein product [Plutella xylostella]|uniref:(diamondback moth) hypothetical protein n=1 Tax=Plutella xylostella TaxID=51655 RepID=A0A8S4D0D1_PLUXY|nr:unnamed protein product [Plutella xylostella]